MMSRLKVVRRHHYFGKKDKRFVSYYLARKTDELIISHGFDTKREALEAQPEYEKNAERWAKEKIYGWDKVDHLPGPNVKYITEEENKKWGP
jgi:hypothetical protein